MTAETQSSPSSRRAVLAGALGALAAYVAHALGGPSVARATDGDAVKAGNDGALTATKTTGVTTSGGNGLQGVTLDSAASGVYGQNDSLGGFGVAGRAGVSGVAVLADGAGTGLEAHGGPGKWAIAASNFWADGMSIDAGGTAVHAEVHDVPGVTVTDPTIEATNARNGTAVYGFSGGGTPPGPPAKTGVYGVANQDAASYGVVGVTESGRGVFGQSSSGPGVNGFSTSGAGVVGNSATGSGVAGSSTNGVGVAASSNNAPGISAGSFAPSYPAILGRSNANSTGVLGFSGAPTATPPTAQAKTGVFGYADQDSSAQGVLGKTTAGSGVVGSATTGFGVVGTATTGFGVRGVSTSGPGGYFFSGTGDALVAQGKIRNLGHVFFKFAGLGTIAAGTRSKTITPAGIDITSASKVFVTLQSYPGGTIAIQRVARDVTNNRFTVYLTANARYSTTFAWFVIS